MEVSVDRVEFHKIIAESLDNGLFALNAAEMIVKLASKAVGASQNNSGSIHRRYS